GGARRGGLRPRRPRRREPRFLLGRAVPDRDPDDAVRALLDLAGGGGHAQRVRARRLLAGGDGGRLPDHAQRARRATDVLVPRADPRGDGRAGLDRRLHRLSRDGPGPLPLLRRSARGAGMNPIAVWRALRRHGVLGINARNAEYTLRWNPRRCYPNVDDKLRTKAFCARAGIPSPALLGVARHHFELKALARTLAGLQEFVLKPAHGAMGNGILVIRGRAGDRFVTPSG